MLFKEKIKQTKKVRLCSVLLMLVATILPLTTTSSVHAKSSSLDVTSVTILEKSSTITASEPTISDNEIQGGSLSFNEPEDYVIYELSLKNNTAEQFKITSITDNNTNNYLVFTYNYDNDFLAPGDETTATIKIAYAEELINQNLSLDNLVIKINIENENGDTDEISFIPNASTPNTGLFTKNSNISAENNITIIALVAFLAFLTGGIVLIVIKRKTKGAKVGAILLILAFAMVPFAVTAKEKYEISFEFSSIEVQGEFETYSITINPNDGSAPISRDITYGEPIGELPTPEKTGYDFDKWVDNNGNEVTADTIITSDINIQARYVAKNYSITYNLDNGTLPDGESNPENYTIESNDITLINPSKPGYTFTGWTGSNGDTPEVTVVVSNGSTENKSFVANYTANTNTPYTVIHKKQKLDLSGYDIAETEDLTGTTGATIEPAVRTYTGFISPSPQSTTINGEGTTEIVYEYSRESYNFSFNNNEYVTSSKEAGSYPYETEITLTAQERDGYTFTKWSNDETSNPYTFTLTGNVTVEPVYEETDGLSYISATFTQGSAIITTDNGLGSLRQYLEVTAHYNNGSSKTLSDSEYSLNGVLLEGASTITVEYMEKTDTFDVLVTAPSFDPELDLTFTDGTTLGTTTSRTLVWRGSAAARATTVTPFANDNYIFTVTDSSKYQVNVVGVANLIHQTLPSGAVSIDTWCYSKSDTVTPTWENSGTKDSPYVWVALKKNDGTSFTEEELANNAAAVITITKSSPTPAPTVEVLSASSIIPVPDIHDNGHGWTVTGLAYDENSDTFLIGDIGKALPSSPGFASQIIRVSHDFSTVVEQIPLYNTFPNMNDIQGITIDTSDNTIWFASTSERLIRHIDPEGNSLGSFATSGKPSGVIYSSSDDTFWILTTESSNNIINVDKTGTVLAQYTFNYGETLDQGFLDITSGNLYMTAGANYSSRNNVYLFNINTHEQSIIYYVDSYAVEGIWIGSNEMIILNDGYYHSAKDNVNQANFYTLVSEPHP